MLLFQAASSLPLNYPSWQPLLISPVHSLYIKYSVASSIPSIVIFSLPVLLVVFSAKQFSSSFNLQLELHSSIHNLYTRTKLKKKKKFRGTESPPKPLVHLPQLDGEHFFKIKFPAGKPSVEGGGGGGGKGKVNTTVSFEVKCFYYSTFILGKLHGY